MIYNIKYKTFKIILIFFLAFFKSNLLAGIVYSEGYARIINGNHSEARRTAIESAVYFASLENNYDIEGYTIVNDGKLEKDKFLLSSKQNIMSIEVVSEEIKDDTIFVKVRTKFNTKKNQVCESKKN